MSGYWLRYPRQAYLWMSGWITMLAVPAAYVALAAGTPALFTGPISTAIVNVVSPAERASAAAL